MEYCLCTVMAYLCESLDRKAFGRIPEHNNAAVVVRLSVCSPYRKTCKKLTGRQTHTDGTEHKHKTKPFMTQAASSAKDSSAGMEELSFNPILHIVRDSFSTEG